MKKIILTQMLMLAIIITGFIAPTSISAADHLVYYPNTPPMYTPNRVITTTSNLYVRNGPGTNYSKRGYFSGGSLVYVSNINGNWGYVPYAGGYICLTYTKNVQATGVGKEVFWTSTKSGCNVMLRKGPSTSFAVVKAVPNRSIINCNRSVYYGKWTFVTYKAGGKTYRGWMCSDYIDFGYSA